MPSQLDRDKRIARNRARIIAGNTATLNRAGALGVDVPDNLGALAAAGDRSRNVRDALSTVGANVDEARGRVPIQRPEFLTPEQNAMRDSVIDRARQTGVIDLGGPASVGSALGAHQTFSSEQVRTAEANQQARQENIDQLVSAERRGRIRSLENIPDAERVARIEARGRVGEAEATAGGITEATRARGASEESVARIGAETAGATSEIESARAEAERNLQRDLTRDEIAARSGDIRTQTESAENIAEIGSAESRANADLARAETGLIESQQSATQRDEFNSRFDEALGQVANTGSAGANLLNPDDFIPAVNRAGLLIEQMLKTDPDQAMFAYQQLLEEFNRQQSTLQAGSNAPLSRAISAVGGESTQDRKRAQGAMFQLKRRLEPLIRQVDRDRDQNISAAQGRR